jgi:hypothetical protein
MGIYFSFSIQGADGNVITTPLCEDGGDIQVNTRNRKVYMKKLLAFKNHNQYLSQMAEGFGEIVELKHLKIFNACDSLSYM